MRFLPIIGLIIVSVSFSHIAIQTDWSGGGGIQGPVLEWGDAFWSSDLNINFAEEKLQLSYYSIPAIEHTIDENFNGARSVFFSDIDGDGDADILGAANYADDITWWENTDGTGLIWTEHTVDGDFEGAWSVYSADIDGDGDADILGAAAYADDIAWWENTDGTGVSWIEHTLDVDFDGASCVHSSDIDGDGDTDILGTAWVGGYMTWWENTDGTGTSWTEHTVVEYFDGASCVYSTDIDGDGDFDILASAAAAEEITWWENTDGTGTSWIEHCIDGEFDGAYCVYSDDIDGDGDADILGVSIITDEITWWENTDGTGVTWTKHTVDGNFDGACSVYSTDLDGDGDADILGAAGAADDIIWWENTDGTGENWVEHSVDGNFDGAMSVCSTDIDGDGDVDIFGAAPVADDITWWEVTEYSPEGYLESSILDVGTLDTW